MPYPFIIPFYKNQAQLDQCLAALNKQTTPVTPWVWDNSVNNLYYTRAANLGLKQALNDGHEFAFTSTQDCYLHEDAVAAMLQFMAEHPRCALAGIKQLLAAEPDMIIHGGGTVCYPAGHHRHGRVSSGDCAQSLRVPWVNGTCMIARLEAVTEFGLMDENMKLLGCDSDWCYTARARQWEVWYCAPAVCLHEAGVSSRQPTPELARVFQADMSYWRDKWIGSSLYARLASEFDDNRPTYTDRNVMVIG